MTAFGFIHPNGNYFEASGESLKALLPLVPAGSQNVPLRAAPPITPEEARAGMEEITPRQLRLTLLTIGIHEADVDIKLVNDPAGMVEWKYATYFKRSHPLVDGLGALFSITAEQTDSLWAWAAAL
jgi:hypothetical protein